MGPSPVSIVFRFSHLSRQRGPAPLTALRGHIPATPLPLSSLPRQPFSHGTCLQNSSSDSQGSRYSGNGTQSCLPRTEARCLCREQRRVIRVDTTQDPGTSRSPLLDATLTAFMGIGIGKPSFLSSVPCFVSSLFYCSDGFKITGDLPHVDDRPHGFCR
jgi:hypothetical protein